MDATDVNSLYYHGIEEAHKEQKKIGHSAFMSGFLSHKWGEIQDQYYRIVVRDSKYNIIRWKQSILRLIYEHGHTLWTEWCTIISAENKMT